MRVCLIASFKISADCLGNAVDGDKLVRFQDIATVVPLMNYLNTTLEISTRLLSRDPTLIVISDTLGQSLLIGNEAASPGR
jgi:hypothetical protein